MTNTSVNPARSTAPALFVQGAALSQLWLFWVAPILGAAIAGLLYNFIFAEVVDTTKHAVVAKPEYEALPNTSA